MAILLYEMSASENQGHFALHVLPVCSSASTQITVSLFFSLFLILHLLLCFDPLDFILLFAFVLPLYKLLFVPHFLTILIIPILYFMTFLMSFHFHLWPFPLPIRLRSPPLPLPTPPGL